MIYKNVVAAVIPDEFQRILICQRPVEDSYGGYWEFPGGTIDDGETPEQALIREIKEELNITIELDRIITSTSYLIREGVTVNILFYLCRFTDGEINLMFHDDSCWIYPKDFKNYSMPPADITVCEKLEQFYSSRINC